MEKKRWELEEKQRWLVETRIGSGARHSKTFTNSHISRPSESMGSESPNKRLRSLSSALE